MKVTGLQVATVLQAQGTDFQDLVLRITLGVWEENVKTFMFFIKIKGLYFGNIYMFIILK